ncbi:hypothetical protein MTR67_035277 [Solanum verrucosum]|uniref:Reverse transcriptase RNase H-like domain-containing protein n=1 Tax=Solanum verrucosum TaxID=315347 RepID=A0AAF0U9P4_SOLVR|nr:hypothetical protein MTR67_035277 [Solanum verrucosum]
MEQEFLAVVYGFEIFRAYFLGNKVVVHIDHAVLQYLMAKKEAKLRLICWVPLFHEFCFEVMDRKDCENQECADHIIRRSIHEVVVKDILETFHASQVGGHHGVRAKQTTFKSPIGMSPLKISVWEGMSLAFELEHETLWTLKRVNIDWEMSLRNRVDQLLELDEFCLKAYDKSSLGYL